ncbi:MAG: hypothetical protein EXQ96_00090 [Alphaproteobacteria bacterium]|nr:hypothetical protein [Alphaproteobacteria bacterium]
MPGRSWSRDPRGRGPRPGDRKWRGRGRHPAPLAARPRAPPAPPPRRTTPAAGRRPPARPRAGRPEARQCHARSPRRPARPPVWQRDWIDPSRPWSSNHPRIAITVPGRKSVTHGFANCQS